jgi:hypothetical protein
MEIEKALSQFTGTLNYHRFNPFCEMVLTDGAQYLAQKAGCYWLFELIAGAQRKKKVAGSRGFIVWRIVVKDDDSCVIEGYRDSPFTEENLLYTQEIEYTDFKSKTGMSEFEFYQEGDVILLKSEH